MIPRPLHKGHSNECTRRDDVPTETVFQEIHQNDRDGDD